MTPEVLQLDPVSVYLDYLIRSSLPKNAPLSPKDIILSRVLSGALIASYPDTLVIEHRQSRPFNELALTLGDSPAIEDMLFKSNLTTRQNLNTRRIQPDVNNCKGWHYGRPILLTIATMSGSTDGVTQNFIVTNSYLGEQYAGPTKGLLQLPELKDLLEAHYATMHQELGKDKPGVINAVA